MTVVITIIMTITMIMTTQKTLFCVAESKLGKLDHFGMLELNSTVPMTVGSSTNYRGYIQQCERY